MHSWTTTAGTAERSGTADTSRDAWRAGLDAAAELVREHVHTPMSVTVNDETAHLRPQHTDAGTDADTEATLQALDGMRSSILGDQ